MLTTWTARIAASVAALGVIGIVGAGSASATTPAASKPLVSCTSPTTSNKDDGFGYLDGVYNLKVAPYAACGSVTTLYTGAEIYFWCWDTNAYGDRWVYGREAGTDTYGWMSVDNFSEYTTDNYPKC